MSLSLQRLRVGGRSGRHARVTGLWFDPAAWIILAATLVWWLRMFHQSQCLQTDAKAPVKTMLRMCYSDVPIVWSSNGWATGAVLNDRTALPQLPVPSFLAALGRMVSGAVRPSSNPGTAQGALELGNVFQVVNAVLLFCFFLAWALSHMLMGRDSMHLQPRDAGGRLLNAPRRSLDGLFIATSVGVLTAGLIAWDLVAPALTAIALLLWATGRPEHAGVLTGLALGAGIAPVVLVVALSILCLRAGKRQEYGHYLVATLAALAVVLALAGALSAKATRTAYLKLLDPDPGLGSLWWMAQDAGLSGQIIPFLSKVLIAAAFAAVLLLALHAPQRPRVAQVGCLLMMAGLVLAPTYSPQYVLWVLGWVALARPRLRDWLVFSGAELLYWAATWQHLQGNLRLGPGDDMAYPLAILVRVGALLWIGSNIVRDMLEPWRDDLRLAGLDDPQGGVLDRAADARWMTEPPLAEPSPTGTAA